MTTSTHILPFAGIPLLVTDDIEQVRRALALHRVICMGTPAAEGEADRAGTFLSVLADAADYVIVEADGSKRLPLKAHASHEPVIPENTRKTVCVVGASGFGKPVKQAVHRPELFCARTGAHMSSIVTPELAAQGIIAEHLADIVVLNQAETVSTEIAKKIHRSTEIQRFYGCLHNIKSHFRVNHRIHFPFSIFPLKRTAQCAVLSYSIPTGLSLLNLVLIAISV